MHEDIRVVLRTKGFIRQPDGSYSKVAPSLARPCGELQKQEALRAERVCLHGAESEGANEVHHRRVPRTVRLTFHIADRRRRDIDGMTSTILDCMVKAGAIPDDNRFDVGRLEAVAVDCEHGQERVEVEIEHPVFGTARGKHQNCVATFVNCHQCEYRVNLPVTITPCPIIQTVVEIRFEPSVPPEAVYGLIYQALSKDFPKTSNSPIASLPLEARKSNPALALQPLFFLEGEKLNIGIGDQNVTIGTKGPYLGWKVISELFKNTGNRILNCNVIKRPTRFGLRYINFFTGNVFDDFTLSLSIGEKKIPVEGTFIKTIVQTGKYKLLLQAGNDLQVNNAGTTASGCIIDIDAFVLEPETASGIEGAFVTFLEEAHGEEKQLFFNLLKDDFVKKYLNPVYE